MSRSSQALLAALDSAHLSQNEFAKLCGLSLSQINRYVRGKTPIGAGNIQVICRALPEQQRGQVLAAWLRDMIPENASGLVSIRELPSLHVAEQPDEFTDLSPQLYSAMRYLIGQAREHTEISDLMIDLEKALRGAKE